MAPPNLDQRRRRLPQFGQQPQQGPVGQDQSPDTSIRSMANEQYRNALLRRAQQNNQQQAQPQQLQAQQGQGNPLADMLRTRVSRRVMRAGRS